MSFTLGIHCGHLLSMAGGDANIQSNVFIGIHNSQITYIGSRPPQVNCPVVEAQNKIVMPGLINGHTHLAMNLLRGIGDDQSLQEWLEKVIFPLEGSRVNPEFVREGTSLALQECMRSGVTTVCDMYYFEDVVGECIEKVGLRGIAGESFNNYPTPDNKALDENYYRILDRMRERFHQHPRVTVAVAPHAPYTCSDELLSKAARYAQTHSLPFLIHVSETQGEVRDSYRQFGKSPVERLHALGVFDGPAIIAHGVHMSDNDLKILQRHSVGVIHNPESNLKLASGIAPVSDYLRSGIRLGLGTDGAASNNNLNMFQEMDTAAKLQKLKGCDPTAMTAVEALRLATHDGARAIGMEDRIGSIEVGKLADIIVIGYDTPNMQPLHDIPSQLVYAAHGNEVETVICHGQIRYQNPQ